MMLNNLRFLESRSQVAFAIAFENFILSSTRFKSCFIIWAGLVLATKCSEAIEAIVTIDSWQAFN